MTKEPMIVYQEDEYSQSFFSDDSVNLNRVLSWRAQNGKTDAPALRIDFHNSFFFDSARTCTRPELLQKALQQLKASANPFKKKDRKAICE